MGKMQNLKCYTWW